MNDTNTKSVTNTNDTKSDTSTFKEFDLWKDTYIKDQKYSSPSMIINGSRGSGKNFFLNWLIAEFGHNYFETAYLFSKTAKLQDRKAYDFIPMSQRFDNFNEEKLREIITTQMNYVETARGMTLNGEIKKPKHILIILDDIITDPKVRTSTALKDLYMTGRHLFICPVTLCHSLPGREGLGPLVRQNADFVICFSPAAQYDRELIASRWLSMISIKEGREICKQLTTTRYQAMVIVASKQCDSRVYQDYVYYKIAKEAKKIVLNNKKSSMEIDWGRANNPSKSKGFKLSIRTSNNLLDSIRLKAPDQVNEMLKNHSGT